MLPHRPYKLYFLAIIGTILVIVASRYRNDDNQEAASQWAMPKAAPKNTGANKDPFPEPKKVLSLDDIRKGHWESEKPASTSAAQQADGTESVDQTKK